MSGALGHYSYWAVAILLMIGLYTVMAHSNLVKKLIGLSIFQSAVFLMYISLGKREGGTAPIVPMEHGHAVVDPSIIYSHPLPHVLILTAIVVGVATTAVGLALVVRINEAYGSIEERDALNEDRKVDARQDRRG